MIVSHKHKFIFVKTHKTSTQTFMKFIKPHLGSDDIMAGDHGNDKNEDTKINVNNVFSASGLAAADYQKTYGNHLPWFLIKKLVGDDIWNTYTKFTIERDPHDRLVSLFCFLNSLLVQPSLFQPSPELRSKMKGPEIKELLQNSILNLYPDQVREYFEEITLMQLEAPVLPLTDPDTYGVAGVEAERPLYRETSDRLGFRLYEVDDVEPVINDKLGPFPYLDTSDICVRLEPFQFHRASEGQCRFLNYGYYHDGDNLQVDKVIDFDNIGDNIGTFFKEHDIDIPCDKQIYDDNSQNVHYRKSARTVPVSWWYEGSRGAQLKSSITSKFPDLA